MPAGGAAGGRGAAREAPLSPSLAVTSPCPWRTGPCGAARRAPRARVSFRCDGSVLACVSPLRSGAAAGARTAVWRRRGGQRGAVRASPRPQRAVRAPRRVCVRAAETGRMRRDPPSVPMALRGREPALKLLPGIPPRCPVLLRLKSASGAFSCWRAFSAGRPGVGFCVLSTSLLIYESLYFQGVCEVAVEVSSGTASEIAPTTQVWRGSGLGTTGFLLPFSTLSHRWGGTA